MKRNLRKNRCILIILFTHVLISVNETASLATIPNGVFHPFSSDGRINRACRSNSRVNALFDGNILNGESNFYIREGTFSDLCRVANIIVDSFYNPSIFVRPFLYTSELQRLQDNFPYDNQLHSYYVACSKKDDEAVGFVDIDARPSKHSDAPPRPYLSDLAIDKYHRRLGLAKTLVRMCENRVRELGMNRMFLRVERDNSAARKMYENLGYDERDHHIFGIKDTTILLERCFEPDA